MTDDYDAYYHDVDSIDPKTVRLNYLKFLRDVVFGSNRQLEVVKCRKFPEFGIIQRDQIDFIINCVQKGEDVYILDGPQSLGVRKIEASKWSDEPVDINQALTQADDPDDLIGMKVTINLKEDDMNSSLDPEFLEREAARMLARAEVLRAIPQTDTFGDGQVLTFEKNFHSGVTYYYAAIKSGEWWFVTGSRAPSKVEWVSLIEFLSTEGMKTLKVVDRERSIPIADYVKGVQKVLEDK